MESPPPAKAINLPLVIKQRPSALANLLEKFLKEEHPEKTLSPISVTELGMVMDVKSQFQKASSPILVTELGIEIEVNDKQCAKAFSPILVTELGMVTDVNGKSKKASSPISVTISVKVRVTVCPSTEMASTLPMVFSI